MNPAFEQHLVRHGRLAVVRQICLVIVKPLPVCAANLTDERQRMLNNAPHAEWLVYPRDVLRTAFDS